MKKIARLRLACFLPLLLLAGCSKSAPETAATTPAGTTPPVAAQPGAPGTPSVKSAGAGRTVVSPMGSEEMAGEAPALPPPAPVVIPRGTVLRVRLNSGL